MFLEKGRENWDESNNNDENNNNGLRLFVSTDNEIPSLTEFKLVSSGLLDF